VANAYVRYCPVCDRENPPERARCACGASLAGVDFSLKRDAAAAAPESSPATSQPSSTPSSTEPSSSSAMASPPAASATPTEAPAAATIACPYPDCAQPNPPGRERCVYCNRPLAAPVAAIPGARPLPSALASRYRIVDAFPATGSEADILLVADVRSGERRVAKLYRHGITPDFRLLDILAQSVGDAVVRVLEHGVSDGVAYELLEYVPGGTLAAMMQAGPLPKSAIRRIVKEITEALAGIHAHHILHRDLKPENVLIRQASPLELALTDFGIASIAAGTQHFTSAARTTKYAAPEALTGVIDVKSDWWSLGMIVLEAASGRHPFDGLTEQVMNHHLATRPIDVRGVYDDELRMLCRGLLLRNPQRRWGAAEVERWLASDPALAMPDDADGVATVVRPYRFGATEATSAGELALALAKHWDEARKDLARGQVARWLEDELHDYNLVRRLRDIEERKDASEDLRLLRFLIAAAPDLPPVWRGAPVGVDQVLTNARAAANDDDDAQTWLDSLYRDGVLALFAAAGHTPLGELDRTWREGWSEFTPLWEAAREAEEQWRTRARDVGGGPRHRAVSFDDLVYAASGRLALPPRRTVHGPLLLVQTDPDFVAAMRAAVVAGLGPITGYCAWFETLWEKARQRPIGVLAARCLLPHAQDDAAAERRRQGATADARARTRDDAKAALRAAVSAIVTLVPEGDDDLPSADVARLMEAFDAFNAACENVLRLEHADDEYESLRRSAEKLSSLGLAAQRALADVESRRGVNAIFLTPQRLAIGAAIVVGALLLRSPVILLVVIAAVVIVLGWRWFTGFEATDAALAKLKQFGLSARTFLRTDEAGKREDAQARPRESGQRTAG
jgi:hypothetical protein